MKNPFVFLVISILFLNRFDVSSASFYTIHSDFNSEVFATSLSNGNGNSSNTKDPVVLVNGQDTVIFDFSTAFCTASYMEVPVRFNSDELIYALDFALQFDPGVFTYVSIVNHTTYLTYAATYNSSDSTLRLSSYSFIPMDNNVNLISIRFSLPVSQIDFAQFDSVYTLLNGDNCSSKAIPSIPPPVIFSGGTTTIIPGDSLALSITTLPGFTYLWSNGETDSLIYATGPGLYSVNTFYANGCNSITSILLSPPDPLPIDLLNFAATLKEEEILIYWSTASEINNSYFSLEHSADGLNWNELAVIEGAGNSNSTKQYSFLDQNPFPSWNYYKLMQVDFDGHFTYSSSISKEWKKIGALPASIKIYPNPSFKRELQIELDNYVIGAKIELTILNNLGKIVYSTNFTPEMSPSATTKLELNLENSLPEGIYFLVYRSGTEELMKKLIFY